MARNSIGEESYVADELITARSKKRLRIVNTDAEGRMVMCDLLNEAKDMALNEKNPFLFTIATLTGHVIRAYGDNYTVGLFWKVCWCIKQNLIINISRVLCAMVQLKHFK